MARIARRCADCGTITRNGARCPTCTSVNQNTRWGADYQQLRPIILNRDRHRCQINGPHCTTIATTVDHIDPDGPRAHPDNLQAACQACNSAKRDN